MHYIVYHNADFDGFCSAAIIYLALTRTIDYANINLIGMDYHDVFPIESIQSDDTIHMADFSLSVEQMDELSQKIHNFYWIDHHKSALDKSIGTSFEKLPGIRQIGKAACELCWEYYFTTELPRAVFLLGRYDVWDHEDRDVLPFQMGIRLNSLDIGKNITAITFWRRLFGSSGREDEFFRHILLQGEIILKYQEQSSSNFIEKCGYEITFENLRALVVNKLFVNSKFFESKFNPDQHDIMIAFGWTGSIWKVSLYTPKDIDLSVIASAHGGGGHPQACGFHTDDISFLIPKAKVEQK